MQLAELNGTFKPIDVLRWVWLVLDGCGLVLGGCGLLCFVCHCMCTGVIIVAQVLIERGNVQNRST